MFDWCVPTLSDNDVITLFGKNLDLARVAWKNKVNNCHFEFLSLYF